jgi:transcriptional regulator with XRE-family HTH domain
VPKFSDILKSLREEYGLTQQELADKVQKSKSSINMYERGEREPNFETMENFADLFNVDMDFLYGRQNIKNKWHLTSETMSYQNKKIYTDHETKVITAYRNQPEMQPAVDRLLNISKEDDKKQKYTSHATIAAFGGDGVEVRHLTKEQDEALTAAMKELHNKKRLR